MGVAERREREKRELRGKIMDAARRLFVEHGYEAVSMRMIAREIEYSPTAIYLHFRDKDTLFQELCAADFLSLAGQFHKVAQIADPVERLAQIGMLYVDFARDFPNQYRLMFMTPTPAKAFDQNGLVDKGNPEQDAYGFLRQTLADGIAAGRFRPELDDAEQLAQLMWAGVHGVVSLHIAKGNDPWIDWRDMRQTAERMVEINIRGIVRTGAG